MIKKIKELINKIVIEFKPKYTQTVSDITSEQCYLYKCYKNDKYTHSVKMHYFTKTQIEDFQKIVEEIYLK